MEFKPQFCTDAFMKSLWKCLVRDFRSIEGPDYCVREEVLLSRSIQEFREHTWPARSQAPVAVFKQQVQLENLFKRYRFKDDVYTDQELEQRTFTKFCEHQLTLRDTNCNVSLSTYMVVQRARGIIRKILGEYNLDEHIEACRFGIKANLGVPASRAYLDVKLATLSGSAAHKMWFTKHIAEDDFLLLEAFEDACRKVGVHQSQHCDESLAMVNVPKSWQIKRGIIPDSVLGSFYSNGLGTVMTRRLDKYGLKIRRLQSKHRQYAKRYSKSRTHVTADLKNASNSYTWSLMCRFLPREWLKACDLGRAKYLTFDGRQYLNMSYMMMGIGYTFPLQTLIFYALIRAIEDLLTNGRKRELVSVYGDDLIYPRAYHPFVVKVFSDLGFTMNKDKTYVQDHFRESCGGDYYHGADVRPFQPEAEHQVLHRKPYVLFLYKTINGLLNRWTEYEIPQTVRFILLEILRAENRIVQVPSEFPDFSGLHLNKLQLEPYWPVVKPRLNTDTWIVEIPRYELKGRDRVIQSTLPYYWLTLRTIASRDHQSATLPTSAFRWIVLRVQPKNYRSKLTGKRLKCRQLAEAEKLVNGAVVYRNN